MSVCIEKHKVTVRGREVIVATVAVVCDNCGGQHVGAGAWDSDDERALDEARRSGLWEVSDDDECEAGPVAVCGACCDEGVTLQVVEDRYRRCVADRDSFVERFMFKPINMLNDAESYRELGTLLYREGTITDDDINALALAATNEETVGLPREHQVEAIVRWVREGQRVAVAVAETP